MNMTHATKSLTVILAAHFVTMDLSADLPVPAETGERPLGAMKTRWAAQVDPDAPLPEYPRPSMVRETWRNLNGRWDHAITPREAAQPQQWEGAIVVPFAVESQLSGVRRRVGPESALWYRRTFEPPPMPDGGRVLLHFGAVDWEATVTVNDREMGTHRGGYSPFSFDITDALRADGGNEIVVRVWDPTNEGSQPRGKQVLEPGGIFYTAVTGIWQTVWLEPVPEAHIRSVTPSGDPVTGEASVVIDSSGAADGTEVEVTLRDGSKHLATGQGTVRGGRASVGLKAPGARPWSPDSPVLHDLDIRLGDDRVASYMAFRSVGFGPDEHGHQRLHLNGRPLFHFGLLDQGWWPDGLYTAPTDEALRFDIEETRAMGFNVARKHVKIEPARWYYWADRLGLMVWQDMPSGFARESGHNIRSGSDTDADLPAEVRRQFRTELGEMVESLRFHPSIVAWVPFNEGWGQHDTVEVLQWTKALDPTRLVGGPSGWQDRGWGDLKHKHSYPGPDMFPPMPDRVSVLAEFGGLGWPKPGHLWWDRRNWGYRTYQDAVELHGAYSALISRLRPLLAEGLAAAIYTQTTDVEGEVNGLLTYDRVRKFDPAWLHALHAPLHGGRAVVRGATLTPTAEDKAAADAPRWRHTTMPPAGGWQEPDFDDSTWAEAPAGFGSEGTPGAVIGTPWTGETIWLRRGFETDSKPEGPLVLRIHHDEDAEVFLNGTRIMRLTDFTTGYYDIELPPAAAGSLRPGRNVLAIHCRNTRGGQFIDAGLFLGEPEP